MKKTLAILLVGCMLFMSGCFSVTSFAANPPEGRAPVHLVAGGAGVATTIFAVHAAMADVVNRLSDNIRITVQATAGSMAHYRMFTNGDIDIGTGSGWADATAFFGGTETFPEPRTDWGTIIIASRNLQKIIVHANSDIETISDLAGRRIGVGSAGSPASEMAKGTLDSLGITNVHYVYLTSGEVADMFIDGQIDAYISTNPVGNAIIVNVITSVDSRFISLTEEDRQIAMSGRLAGRVNPGYLTHYDYPEAIPAGQRVITITDYGSSSASINVPDDIIYDIVSIFWENIDEIRIVAAGGTNADMEDITLATGLIHPGAARFYRERGIYIPDSKITQR
jgi:TRAP transporter TAXI family solute receptor